MIDDYLESMRNSSPPKYSFFPKQEFFIVTSNELHKIIYEILGFEPIFSFDEFPLIIETDRNKYNYDYIERMINKSKKDKLFHSSIKEFFIYIYMKNMIPYGKYLIIYE